MALVGSIAMPVPATKWQHVASTNLPAGTGHGGSGCLSCVGPDLQMSKQAQEGCAWLLHPR